MNILSILGIILTFAIMGLGLSQAASEFGLGLYYDLPSIFIVVGGTFGATAISFQLNRLFVLLKIFFRRVVLGKKQDYIKVIKEIIQINESHRKGEALDGLSSKANDYFLKEGLELAKTGVLKSDDILRLLDERNENMYALHMDEANKIKVVGKFPPAFGMIGTTMGMIVLLANLSKPDAMKFIGPAMGVCLITTLYGALIANTFLIPVSENLLDDSKEIYLKNQIIIRGVELIIEKTNPILLAEELNSFLPPSKRIDWKKLA